jgi:hypothetical protein
MQSREGRRERGRGGAGAEGQEKNDDKVTVRATAECWGQRDRCRVSRGGATVAAGLRAGMDFWLKQSDPPPTAVVTIVVIAVDIQ